MENEPAALKIHGLHIRIMVPIPANDRGIDTWYVTYVPLSERLADDGISVVGWVDDHCLNKRHPKNQADGAIYFPFSAHEELRGYKISAEITCTLVGSKVDIHVSRLIIRRTNGSFVSAGVVKSLVKGISVDWEAIPNQKS